MSKIPKQWYEELVSLCQIQSHSDNEKFMLLYLIQWIEEYNLDWVIDDVGNLIVTKGKAKTYPCIVSHMDTVHKCISDYTVWKGTLNKQDALWAQSGKKETGIGGDDKCGVFACLFFLKTLPSVKVVFFTQEECGCKGSDSIDLQFFKDCRYIIQLDRRGAHDFIDSKFNQKTISHQFSSEIGVIKKKYKFKSTQGTITDSINLFNRDVGISCVNISSGYYSPHSVKEYILVNELWNSILFTQEIIKTLKPKIYQHKKKEITYNNNNNSYSIRKQCELCHQWTKFLEYQLIDRKAYCYDCLRKSDKYSKCDECYKYVKTADMKVIDKKKWVCKLCGYKLENKAKTKNNNDDNKQCGICKKDMCIKHGHENVVVTTHEDNIIFKKSYDFVCYLCYSKLAKEKQTPLGDWIECSVCKVATDPMFGIQDGELFTCNDCLSKDKQYSAYCEFCNKEFTLNINDYDRTEFVCPECEDKYPDFLKNENEIVKYKSKCSICFKDRPLDSGFYNGHYDEFYCKECIDNYTEKCVVCNNITPIELGNYFKGEFMCVNCIAKSAQSTKKK